MQRSVAALLSDCGISSLLVLYWLKAKTDSRGQFFKELGEKFPSALDLFYLEEGHQVRVAIITMRISDPEKSLMRAARFCPTYETYIPLEDCRR